MTFIFMILASVGIGWFAQTKKDRVGAKWALLTFLALTGAWMFLFICTSLASPHLYDNNASFFGLGVLTILPVSGILALIVWSLPMKKGTTNE